MATNTRIYSATYSNVPVYEFNVGPGVHIMRRRADDWINATHILKAAGFDKPARTRILEREVQKGVHEKVQGGYGKYQGTWIPLPDGRALAQRNKVLDPLLPIFDYVPGATSPPPAPKHATAASTKPRGPRQTAAARRQQAAQAAAAASQASQEIYEVESIAPYAEDQTPDDVSVMTGSIMEDDIYNPQFSASKKRKRGQDQPSMQDQEHQIWADTLLDYFMLADSEDRFPAPPSPPPSINLDRAIDEKGHSALHWAAAMGDLEVVKDLLSRGARIDVLSNNLETPLMRAVMFTNNYDKNTMGKLVRLLHTTVIRSDWFGSTVFHHITATTSSKNKYLSARYYLDTIINCLAETWVPEEITRLLNLKDQHGDTAIHIAARNGARKCVRSLLGRNVTVDTPNAKGETADDMIRELNNRRRLHPGATRREASSSPFVPDRAPLNGDVSALTNYSTSIVPQYRSQTANALVNRVAPTIVARLRALATAYEAEFEERESEALENEQVIRKRTAEIEALRRQSQELDQKDELIKQELNGESEEEERHREEEELHALEAEAMSLLEHEQRETLRSSISKALNGGVSGHRGGPNGVAMDGNMESKTALATQIVQVQAKRQQLTRDIVRSLGTAGLGERQADYKRLVLACLKNQVREDELDGALDDIIAQLDEERREKMALDEAL